LGQGGLTATHERDSERRENSETAQAMHGAKKIPLRQ
jgi:hypothetical protein